MYRREHTRTDASDDDYKSRCLTYDSAQSVARTGDYKSIFRASSSELEGTRGEEEEEEVDLFVFFISHVFFFAGRAANATTDDDEKTCQELLYEFKARNA